MCRFILGGFILCIADFNFTNTHEISSENEDLALQHAVCNNYEDNLELMTTWWNPQWFSHWFIIPLTITQLQQLHSKVA